MVSPFLSPAPMDVYYLDSSALVKRYAAERGTAWIQTLFHERTTALAVAHIGLVEIAAALASKRRGSFLPEAQYNQLMAELLQEAQSRYVLVRVSDTIIDWAIDLTRRRRLRGYDAVHLACALTLNRLLLDQHLAPLILVAADHDLLAAAEKEGLATKDPTLNP